jgi:biotin operon repressor
MPLPILHSNRNFGIEIECLGISIDQAVRVLRNARIDISFEGYNHVTRTSWKIVTDSSVADGFEVVSPILSGNEGIAMVVKVAKTLLAAGARVDRRCGFHVHVDARELSGADVLNIIRRYAAHESLIDTMMPTSRRGTSNTYCRSMPDVLRAMENVSESASTLHVCERVYERYYKLNVQAFTRHGTVEFRQHSGTVDYKKMVNWIIFCIQFVEDSRTVRVQIPESQILGSTLRQDALKRKFIKLAELLDNHRDRYNPCPAAKIAEILEIEESSVPSFISYFRGRFRGAQILARRNRGYYNESQTELLPVVTAHFSQPTREKMVTPEEEGIFSSLPPEVVQYFEERIQDLSLS